MPKLFILNKPPKHKDKHLRALAIIKGEREHPMYNKFLVLDDRDTGKINGGEDVIEIDDDVCFQMLPHPNKDKRDVYYVAGASGSGKSYLARTIADNYSKMYPDRPIYVISKLEADETLDAMKKKPIRIPADYLLKNPVDINNLGRCMFICDDYDVIEGKEGKAVHTLIDDIATMGRAHGPQQGGITMLCLTHHITNYKKTRVLLNESNWFCVYPQSTSTHALSYLLKNHLGMERDEVKALKKLGRWVCLHKNYPQLLVSSQKCMLLVREDD